MNIDVVDDNIQCPFCLHWYKEGAPVKWHIRARHSSEAQKYHRIFQEASRAGRRKRQLFRSLSTRHKKEQVHRQMHNTSRAASAGE